MSLLQVEDLTITLIQQSKSVTIVNGINFSVNEGEVLGIVGESGCGKSVTALAITGLLDKPLKVTGGKIIFAGADLLGLEPGAMRGIRGAKIGMVFQNPMSSFNPLKTVYSHFKDSLLTSFKMDRKTVHKTICTWLEKVGLPQSDAFLQKYPFQLSGGMLQRLMIATVLAKNPCLLIADEPTTALDVTTQAEVLKVLKKLQQELKLSIILISHDFSVIEEMADKIGVMYAGQIVEYGAAAILFRSPLHPYTRALLRSVIRINVREKIEPITGQPPAAFENIEGCAFYPRCPHAAKECARKKPVFGPVGRNHYVACLEVNHGILQS